MHKLNGVVLVLGDRRLETRMGASGDYPTRLASWSWSWMDNRVVCAGRCVGTVVELCTKTVDSQEYLQLNSDTE